MDRTVFKEWLQERRAIDRDPRGTVHLFLDNCGGHVLDEEALEIMEEKDIQIHYLPKNSTHLTQPLDSFIIKNIKEAWKRRWAQKKLEMIQNGQWQNSSTSNG